VRKRRRLRALVVSEQRELPALVCMTFVLALYISHLLLCLYDEIFVGSFACYVRVCCQNNAPEIWNNVSAELRLSTLSTATFTQHLKAHPFVSAE